MNIDVREYLRINPISVHDLTLSGDFKDCFLFFPIDNSEEGGYSVYTQRQMFDAIMESIFQDLIESKGGGKDGFKLRYSSLGNPVTWSDSIKLKNIDKHFKVWVRNKTWNDKKTNLESEIKNLETELDNKILNLKRWGRVNYKGAVELQSVEMKKFADLFETFLYSTGQIWCYGNGTNVNGGDGYGDNVEIPTVVQHNHNPTRAEAASKSFIANFGGNNTLGKFYTGTKELVSQDSGYAISNGTNLVMTVQTRQDGDLTYPLWGENVIDWRNPEKTHNNVPPCTNIRVRYTDTDISDLEGFMKKDLNLNSSDVEAKYESLQVADLEEEYGAADLTDHDYILRMSLDGSNDGELKIMKQSMRMLLDLFTEECNSELSQIGDDEKLYSMEDILKPKLESELVLKTQFVNDYSGFMARLTEIGRKIQEYNALLVSMKPIVYVGKIIISTTDNTEEKVIKNYGGVKWRRMLNFLRGVGEEETENHLKLGNKWGEANVCLRESNVPIHTHIVQLKNDEDEPGLYIDNKTTPEQWMQKQKAGQKTDLVNQTGTQQNGIANTTIEYEISPLDYKKEGSAMTIPHDNIPPYREVYIWECLETTDEEMEISGKPYEIVYDLGIADDGQLPQNAPRGYRPDWVPPDLPKNLEKAKSSHYIFNEWQDDSQNHTDDASATNVTLDSVDGKQQIPTGTSGTVYLRASWTAKTYTITWDANIASYTGPKPTWHRDYGTELGTFPPASITGYTLLGWFTEPTGGDQIYPTTKVSGDATYYAHWEAKTYQITFDALDGTVQGRTKLVKSMRYGQQLGTLPEAIANARGDDWSELNFDGWYTGKFDGIKITSSKLVTGDATYYARYNGIVRYEKVGPTIQVDENEVASNFSLGNYIRSSQELDFRNDFEIVINATTGSGSATDWDGEVKDVIQINQEVFGMVAYGSDIEFGIYRGKFMWEIVSGAWGTDGSGTLGENTCAKDTNYYWKIVKDGENITCYISENGVEWKYEKAGTRKNITVSQFVLGYDIDSISEWWRGTIDLEKSYINVYGHKYTFRESDKITVTFDLNGGKWDNSETRFSIIMERGVKLGSRFPGTSLASRENHTFQGWWTDKDNGNMVNQNTVIDQSITVYAHWMGNPMEAILSISKLDTATWQDGTDNNTNKYITVQNGQYYPKPIPEFYPPHAPGYNLIGWKPQNSALVIGLPLENNKVNLTTSNNPLHAQWRAKTFRVTLNLNNSNPEYTQLNATWKGGGNANQTKDVTYGENYNLGLVGAPESSFYTFKCWRLGDNDFTDGGYNLSSTQVNITEDSTLYAQWTPKPASITLKPNFSGGSVNPTGDQSVSAQFGRYPPALNKSGSGSTPRVPTLENHLFLGYYDGSGDDNGGFTSSNPVQYYDENGIGKTTLLLLSKTLYAKWQPESYVVTLHFNANPGLWPSIDKYPDKNGWNGNQGNWHKNVSNKTIMATYGIKYPNFDSVIGSSPPEAGGYKFNGWYRGTTSNNGVYLPSGNPVSTGAAEGDTIFDLSATGATVPSKGNNGLNQHLFAQWKPKTYTITFDANGGTPATQTQTVTFGKKVETIPTASKRGSKFDGWYTTDNVLLLETTVYDIPMDSTYYAHWSDIVWNITYNMNGHGTVPAGAKRTYTYEDVENESYTPPNALDVEGWKFTGWNPASIPQGAEGDKIFWSKWIPHQSFSATLVKPHGNYYSKRWYSDDGNNYNDKAKQYLIEAYGGYNWGDFNIRAGIDAIVFAGIPVGPKPISISMDIEITNLTGNNNSSADIVMFLVPNTDEIDSPYTLGETYIDSASVDTQNTRWRKNNGRSLVLATVTKANSITSTTINVTNKPFNLPQSGHDEDTYWDAWVWVNSRYTDIGFTATCKNCSITW